MSYYGWQVLREIEARWERGQRAGKVHPWEASRILGGEYGPITRELEPAFKESEKHVLSRTRPRGSLHRDRLTGVETIYPKPPPEDLFWIEVRDVVRHRAGHWRVRFHVYDRRENELYVRRKPPVHAHGEAVEESADTEQVAIESGYTANPEQSLDRLHAVPREYQNMFTVQAHSRFAERRRADSIEQEVDEDLRCLKSEIKELTKRAVKMGVDPSLVLAPIAREIQVQHAGLKEAA